MRQICDRTGQSSYNNQGSKMTITKYRNAQDIEVTFESGFVVEHTQMHLFNSGSILDPYFKSYCGIGYMGMKTFYNKSQEYKRPLEVWHSMLKRCYSENFPLHVWYKDCEVDEKWHSFSNFYQWWKDNYYELPKELGRLELDKDIKFKSSRIYSPNTCLLIPQRINSYIKNRRDINKKFPIGITYNEKKQKYHVRTNVDGKDTHIGDYNSLDEAFCALKNIKENELKKLAELYKLYIPKEVYDAIVNYTIEITD